MPDRKIAEKKAGISQAERLGSQPQIEEGLKVSGSLHRFGIEQEHLETPAAIIAISDAHLLRLKRDRVLKLGDDLYRLTINLKDP